MLSPRRKWWYIFKIKSIFHSDKHWHIFPFDLFQLLNSVFYEWKSHIFLYKRDIIKKDLNFIEIIGISIYQCGLSTRIHINFQLINVPRRCVTKYKYHEYYSSRYWCAFYPISLNTVFNTAYFTDMALKFCLDIVQIGIISRNFQDQLKVSSFRWFINYRKQTWMLCHDK